MKILAKNITSAFKIYGQPIWLHTICNYAIDVKMKPKFSDPDYLSKSRNLHELWSTGIINENYNFSRTRLSENVKNNIKELVWDILNDTAGVFIAEDSLIVETGHTYRFKGMVEVLFYEKDNGEVLLKLEDDDFQDCIKLR